MEKNSTDSWSSDDDEDEGDGDDTSQPSSKETTPHTGRGHWMLYIDYILYALRPGLYWSMSYHCIKVTSKCIVLILEY